MIDAAAIPIRAATPADAPALARLRYEFRAALEPAAEPESAFVPRCTGWMAVRLGPGGGWRCWVADAEGALVGMAWLHLIEKLPNPLESEPETHGYISSLYVEPSRRGAGLGSRLMEACLTASRSAEVDAVILWPTPASRNLYARHGFAVREDLMELRTIPGFR